MPRRTTKATARDATVWGVDKDGEVQFVAGSPPPVELMTTAELAKQGRVFKITERDLAELERLLPLLISPGPGVHVLEGGEALRVREIVSRVRWSYQAAAAAG